MNAFRTPGLAAYLASYRRQYRLPGPLPRSGVDTGWDLETTLDVAMVSAACPRCKILVVQASSASNGAWPPPRTPPPGWPRR